MNNWPTALHTAIKNMCGKMEGLCSKYSRTSTISSVTNKPRAVKADEKRLAYLHAGKRKEREIVMWSTAETRWSLRRTRRLRVARSLPSRSNFC